MVLTYRTLATNDILSPFSWDSLSFIYVLWCSVFQGLPAFYGIVCFFIIGFSEFFKKYILDTNAVPDILAVSFKEQKLCGP